MTSVKRSSFALSALSLWIAVVGSSLRAAEKKIEYNRDVRPILAENCFACHGADSAARKADLRLDRRDDAIKAEAIVPGDVEKSALIERIFSDNKAQVMPPPKTKKHLTAAQKETLKRWIAAGAEYEAHWSFIAPKRPTPPAVKNTAWVRNPIDRFILAELEKRGLQPAPEADRRTLARRLSLDLTGLPPEPADVEAFVNDKRPDAYERFVDKMLDSPHWGEHRARYWLDAARYADTHGIHFDNYREMWSYRDWVINAFNRNLTFDRFTIEQLAGDLLPNRTLDQLIASGFNRCNITSNEGGLIPEEYLVLYTRDRTETTARVFLGLTANCAVCHDHKFDPLTMKDFYSMSAFFNNTTQGAMDGNIKDTPPVVFVPQLEDRPRWDALVKKLTEARQQVEARKQTAHADFDKWLASRTAETPVPPTGETPVPPTGETPVPPTGETPVPPGLRFHAALNEGSGGTIHLTVDGKPRTAALASGAAWDAGYVAAKAFKVQTGGTLEVTDAGDFDKNEGFSYGAWVKFTKRPASGAIFARMDDQHDFRGWDLWMQNGRVGTHIIHKWPDDALKVVSRNPVKTGQWNHLFITYDGSGQPGGVKVYVNGVPQQTLVEASRLKNTIRTNVPLKIGQRHSTSRIDGLVLQDLRLYDRTLSGPEVERLVKSTRGTWLMNKPAKQRSAAETNELFDWWLATSDTTYQNLAKKLSDLQQEESVLKSRGTIAHVMQEKPGEPMAYVLYRGEYDKRRDPVKADTPKSLPPMPKELPRNRLGFAQWLLRPENPLTARVTVNRFWQEVFGTGIVKTSEDFGVSGELPSNQELLDWLAVEFRETGWDVKRFFKLMVTSSTYRQSAQVTPEKIEKDPDNRLLSRGPRYRLDAEMIRDYALAASGLLVRKLGGPSVKPYQPEGVWEAVAMIGSNTRDYRRDSGDKLYRRSLYTFWKRAAPPASMDIFNAPTREVCTVRRERTNTPLQALVTLNDPQFVEAARWLAQTTLKEAGDKEEGRIDFMARRLLCRPLRAEEMKVVQASLKDLLAHYKANAEDAKKLLAVGEAKVDPKLDTATLAAWTMLANEMMNLDEVLNK
jgi:mono/diheme cytochrome c family protein